MEFGNRSSVVCGRGSGSVGYSCTGSSHVFHGFELLVLRKLHSDPLLLEKWKEKLRTKAADDDCDLGVCVVVISNHNIHIDY